MKWLFLLLLSIVESQDRVKFIPGKCDRQSVKGMERVAEGECVTACMFQVTFFFNFKLLCKDIKKKSKL